MSALWGEFIQVPDRQFLYLGDQWHQQERIRRVGALDEVRCRASSLSNRQRDPFIAERL
jgi:hypothetical protein